MNKMGIWIQAFRLRTLPLALSSTLLGTFLAISDGAYKTSVLILGLLTTLFLQILSNLANDYGDFVNGVDNENRIGPKRVTQQGEVSKPSMRIMILSFVILSLISGCLLIYFGLSHLSLGYSILFFLLGVASIAAAIKYTIGTNPYGYAGFGDVFVFVFFGILGVAGTFFLHTGHINLWILLPAASLGLFSSGVLNLNNLRDIKNDSSSGKRTLVVRMGFRAAKIYHAGLIVLAILLSSFYTYKFYESGYQLISLLTIPFFVLNIKTVILNKIPLDLNIELKKLALSTFAYSITFGLGLIL